MSGAWLGGSFRGDAGFAVLVTMKKNRAAEAADKREPETEANENADRAWWCFLPKNPFLDHPVNYENGGTDARFPFDPKAEQHHPRGVAEQLERFDAFQVPSRTQGHKHRQSCRKERRQTGVLDTSLRLVERRQG